MIRPWHTTDFWWKFFSVVFAAAIWLVVYKSHTGFSPTTSSVVPITYHDLPINLLSTNAVQSVRTVPDLVSVTVEGPANIMDKLQSDQLRAFVDLTGADLTKESQQTVRLSVPLQVTPVRIEPVDVTVLPVSPKP
ncbi:MAG: hypothetical protein KGJ88_03170 [Verrucomicrobiota bacterium]|nr:hypothetical protein [Verrucomicrobiota bacterium]